MSKITIELDPDLNDRLNRLALDEKTSPQQLGREALERLLASRDIARSAEVDPYAPLRAMIGIVEDGPDDASIHHDHRPGDDA